MTEDDIAILRAALCGAEDEIHHPGAARAQGIDLLNLIAQARLIVASMRTDR